MYQTFYIPFLFLKNYLRMSSFAFLSDCLECIEGVGTSVSSRPILAARVLFSIIGCLLASNYCLMTGSKLINILLGLLFSFPAITSSEVFFFSNSKFLLIRLNISFSYSFSLLFIGGNDPFYYIAAIFIKSTLGEAELNERIGDLFKFGTCFS